jgi:hypothetical protein
VHIIDFATYPVGHISSVMAPGGRICWRPND